MVAISRAHALLTNIVLAWNTSRMDGVVSRLRASGLPIEDVWLRRIGPAHFSHINFRGTYLMQTFNRESRSAPHSENACPEVNRMR